MQKSFIVENVEVDLSNLTEKVKKEIEFKIQNVYWIWYSEGRNLEELEVNLWNKLEEYLTVKLKSMEYCNNQPHKLNAFKKSNETLVMAMDSNIWKLNIFISWH